ncbi:MAG: GIY-YIG nuclease family protein [Pseudobdellovibrionaceae bacterium]
MELAWGFGRASEDQLDVLESKLVQLPEEKSIPASVQELTGIQPSFLQDALSLEKVFEKFQNSYAKENQTGFAVIHYAQFEKAFLEDLYFKMTGQTEFPFRILCSQKLAHRVFPHLPSRNIRGLAGHFGEGLTELKRASSHVQATFQIWRKITEQLNLQGILTIEELETWLESKPSIPKVTYQYQIDRDKRLKLPKKPGVYFMKSKTGQILYVGKATSLRDRVNSYFRGKKGRDPKKLEMLTQVWDLDFIETGSALEAALLESDEIKRWNPAYNISLKTGTRGLLFYSKNFELSSFQQNEATKIGPFRANGPIEQLRLLQKSLKDRVFYPIFYEPFTTELMREGLELFCQKYQVLPEQLISIRTQLCLGHHILRHYEQPEEADELETDEEVEIIAEEVDVTPQDIANKIERLLMRAAEEIQKAKKVTVLLNCHLDWESEVGWRSLDIRQGRFQLEAALAESSFPWQDLTIADYDRMSILLSEISRKAHSIEKFNFRNVPLPEPHRPATLPEC